MAEERKYTVYLHVFPNGKVYVGMTGSTLEARWGYGNGYAKQRLIGNAVRKYGWKNIQHEVLGRGLSQEEAENVEIGYIELYKSNDRKYGYNITSGGNHGGFHSDESCAIMSKKQKGRIVSEETRRKMGAASKGRVLSPEARKKISDARKGKTHQMPDSCKRPVAQFSIESSLEIAKYESLYEAQKDTGISIGHISECAYRKRRQAGGYIWFFQSDLENEVDVEKIITKAKRHSLYKPLNLVDKQTGEIIERFDSLSQVYSRYNLYHETLHGMINSGTSIYDHAKFVFA